METEKRSVTHLSSDKGRSFWVLGDLVTFKATGEETGGAYSLFEYVTHPQSGPPPHIQHRDEEGFYELARIGE